MNQSLKIQRIIIIIILALSLLAFYYYLSNRRMEETETSKDEVSKVQSVLLRDLDHDYPPTCKEVIKYFSDISQCFYGETYTEEELEELAKKIRGLYDDELVVHNTWEQYFAKLKQEIEKFKEKDMVITRYTPSASTDVFYFTEKGDSCARMYCTYAIRQGTKTWNVKEVFVLRQDADKHWKIYGWDLADDKNSTK